MKAEIKIETIMSGAFFLITASPSLLYFLDDRRRSR